MSLWMSCVQLFYSFFRIGLMGFGGGYAMMSMIMIECEKFGISMAQFADLNALDMVVPGPIAINAATYVGYLYAGIWGAAAATVAVTLPSFLLVSLVMAFFHKYRENTMIDSALSAIKPAAVGLIAAAALRIAMDVLLKPGMEASALSADPLGAVSFLMVGVFAVTGVANIKFDVNPILLTLLAGVIGAFFPEL